MGTKIHEKEDSFTPRNRLDNSIESCNGRLSCEGAESAISRPCSGMGNDMVPVDKEQNSTFFKKPPPAGEKSRIQCISKVMHMDYSCKFYKWMPALTVSGRLCIKGKVKGITNSLLVTEPIVHRFNNCVVAGNEGVFRLGAFVSAGLPSFIAEKFKKGFPRDWSALCRTWFNFKQQGEPESFTWQEMLWNSTNRSPDADGEKEYSADIETDGEGSVAGNKTDSDTDQSVFHSPLPRSKKSQLSLTHTGRNPLICDSPSSNELLSILKKKHARQKSKSSTNASKNMANLEETPKSFSRRRWSRNLSFYASLSQSVEQKSMSLDASPHQTPDACTDKCFKNGVNWCSTPLVALKNIHSTSNDKQPQGHITSPAHDVVTAETSDQMEISLKENCPESQHKNSRCIAQLHKESDGSFVTPLHTSHQYSIQKISASSQQANKIKFPEKLPSNNNSRLTHASKNSFVIDVKHNQSSHNYMLRSNFREKVDYSLESSDQFMSCSEMDSVDNAEVLQKQSSSRVRCQSQNVQNRSNKQISFLSHTNMEQSSRDQQIPQISLSACEKIQRSFCNAKVDGMLVNGSGVFKNPVDKPCNAVSCLSGKSDADSLETGKSTSDQDHIEESHQPVHSSNQQEVESKLAHLSINTPKENTSNIRDTSGKHYMVNSSREKSVINLEDVIHVSESLKNLNTNDTDHYPSVKVSETEFKVPQALSPLVMVEKLGHLETQTINLKPQMMYNWTPVLLPLTKPRFRLQGQLKRANRRILSFHITKPVKKVLRNGIVSTTDGQRYQLIGPAVKCSDIPENILSQFAKGIPKNWEQVLKQWMREGEVPVPQKKNHESVANWSRSSFSSSVASSTSLDNLQGIAGLSRSRSGRIIVPQLSYWLGERVKKGIQGPIYECNSSVSLLSDSTSIPLDSYRERKRKCRSQLATTRQRTNSRNGRPTSIPIFCTRGSERKVGVEGSEEDKGVPNEGENAFPVKRSVRAARDEISKRLLDTASKEHTKQSLTVNKTGCISESSAEKNKNKKGFICEEEKEPNRYRERRQKSRGKLQKPLKGDDSEQEKCKSRTNSLSEKMAQVVENSVEKFLNTSRTQGERESRAGSSEQNNKINVNHTDGKVSVENSERRNRSRSHSKSKLKEGEKQSNEADKSWKSSNVEEHAERAVEISETLSSSLRKVSRKSMDMDIGEGSGYENMELSDKSSKVICRRGSRSQQKVKLNEELSEKYNKTEEIKQGYDTGRKNRINTCSSFEKQGQSSEQEHSKGSDSEDIELNQENVEETKSNRSHSQYKQECSRKRHESRKSSVLKEKIQHYERSSRSRSNSQRRLVAQGKNSEHGENSDRKDYDHCKRLRSKNRSLNKLNECGELPGKRNKSMKSSIGKKNVNTLEKDIRNRKVQNYRARYEDAGAQIRLDSSEENLKQKQKSSSREKPAKSEKNRRLNAEEFEDKISPEKRHEPVLSTPDASRKNEPLEKALFELPFEVQPLRTMKHRQLANDKLLKMQKAVAVNTDFFGDPECPYDIGENSSGKGLTYSDILNEAKMGRYDRNSASSCSAVTPPAKYYEKILHHAVPLTPCRSPPIEPPIYNRKDVLSRIQQQVQAPIKTYQLEVKTNQQPCEDSIQLRMDMEKKRKEYNIPGYDIKVRYTDENIPEEDDDDGSSFNESRYSEQL